MSGNLQLIYICFYIEEIMDNLQRSWLMGYDAGLWGLDEKNRNENLTSWGQLAWWMEGYKAGEKAKGNIVKPLINMEGNLENNPQDRTVS